MGHNRLPLQLPRLQATAETPGSIMGLYTIAANIGVLLIPVSSIALV